MKKILRLAMVLGLLMVSMRAFSEESWPTRTVPFIGYGDKMPYTIPLDWKLIAVIPSRESQRVSNTVYLSATSYLWFQDKNGNVYVLSITEKDGRYCVDQTTKGETVIHKLGTK